MNQRSGIERAPSSPRSADWVSAAQAARLLSVKPATLYAYVSRGLVRSQARIGGRARSYHRGDLEALRARKDARLGHGPVAASALRFGEPVLDSAITAIGPQGPSYRGHAALSLAHDGVGFERTAELLWTRTLPPAVHWPAPEAPRGVRARVRRPLDGMVLGLTQRATSGAFPPALTVEAELSVARTLIAELACAAGLARGEQAALAARGESTIARKLLVALGGVSSERAVRAMDAALVLCADHELNPSAFVCRVAASTGTDLPRTLLAALATVSGSFHGGASEQIEAVVDEVGAPEHAVRAVAARIRRGDAMLGYGHRLYPDGDPRTGPLLALARAQRSPSRKLRTLLAIVDAMELAGAEPPALDTGLVALSYALKLVPGAPLAMFAVGRAAGWVAHALEQREQGTVLRPRARYVGP